MKELGRVLTIYSSPRKGAPMEERDSVRAIAGQGLEGDRYANREGAYSGTRIPDEDRGVTLISQQAIQQANLALFIRGKSTYDPSETRRNIILEIEPNELNSLVGRKFTLGDVEMEGTELCEPCVRPAALLKRPRDGRVFEEAFKDRGGIRARIVSNGEINKDSKLNQS